MTYSVIKIIIRIVTLYVITNMYFCTLRKNKKGTLIDRTFKYFYNFAT